MLDSTTFINSERVVKSLPTSGMTRTKGLKNPRCKKKNGDWYKIHPTKKLSLKKSESLICPVHNLLTKSVNHLLSNQQPLRPWIQIKVTIAQVNLGIR